MASAPCVAKPLSQEWFTTRTTGLYLFLSSLGCQIRVASKPIPGEFLIENRRGSSFCWWGSSSSLHHYPVVFVHVAMENLWNTIDLLKWDDLKPSTKNWCNSPRTRQHSGSQGSLGRLNFLPGLRWLYSKTVQTCSNYVWKSLELSNNTKAASWILCTGTVDVVPFEFRDCQSCFMWQKPLCGRQCPYKISAADWDVWRHWVKRTTHTHRSSIRWKSGRCVLDFVILI